MGVYIKGMEMPIIEMEWTLRHGADGKWYVIDTNAETSDGEWHEIIPVPPHGDLIDRGYAIATACSGRIRTLPTTEDGENWIRVEEVRESIKNAPTIIPASEDGE